MQIICKIINNVGCPRHLTIASKLLRIKTYLGGVFWVFHGILALFDIYGQRTGVFEQRTRFSRISQKASIHAYLVFSDCFVVFFGIIRHLSREPDFSAKNRIFKKFLKCLRACLVGVFWVFQGISSIVPHLSREPDVWAENQIFTIFLKSLKACLVGVFKLFWHSSKSESRTWIFQPRTGFSRISQKPQNMFSWCFLSVSWYFSIIRHLSREPDFFSQESDFQKFLKMPQSVFTWCFLGVSKNF